MRDVTVKQLDVNLIYKAYGILANSNTTHCLYAYFKACDRLDALDQAKIHYYFP